MADFVIRGMFPQPKPNPKPLIAPWVGFQVEPSVQIDIPAGEARGFQGLIREVPADPSARSSQDSSEPFVVHLTAADVQAIMGVVLARARAEDTMGVYDDPAWPAGSAIVMTVNGAPV
jgi:hypothetical protein